MAPQATAYTALVIGVGNPYRRDDGAGVAALDRLRAGDMSGIEVVESSGDPATLLDIWTGRSLVLLADAVNSDQPAGTINRSEYHGGAWHVPPGRSSTSSHGLGVAEAVELGRALERLPQRLIVFGIAVEDDGDGVGLSLPVEAALDEVVRQIRDEVANATE
jgi:hydrogenase maturation protease